MRILLTNDDGYFAPGLQTLYRVLAQETGYELWIVAPEGQRSATGHSITLFEPLFAAEHFLEGAGQGYAVRGTPSDCVKLAIQGELVPQPDLVISGINRGPNLGTDVFYSGTVSAAMEGVLLGIPALAVSLADFSYQEFEPAAYYIADLLKNESWDYGTGLLNINIPPLPKEQWQGEKLTRLGKAVYQNVFESRIDPHGRKYFWQAGTLMPDELADTDLKAIQDGFVTLTPMHSDLTDYARLKQMQPNNKILDK